MAGSTRPRMWVPLALALGGILVLLVVAEAFSFAQGRSLQNQIHGLVRNAERSTYLIGDTGQRLARLESSVLEALTEPSASAAATVQRVADIERRLQAHAAELPGLLSPRELEIWAAVAPEIEVFVRSLRNALAEIELGRSGEAELMLDQLAVRRRVILDALEASMEVNQAETAQMVMSADQLLARARTLQLAVAILLFAAIVAIAWLAIRALQRRERELARYLERIEGANRDLEAFAGRVAHDLRNVLAPVQSSSRLLALAGGDRQVVLETGERIERVSRRAADLISGLLAFARAGEPSREAVAGVDEELAAVLEELAPLAESVRAEIELDLEPDLRVGCEKALLHVLLLNLVSNAVKFLEGQPRRVVRIRGRTSGGACALEVADTGPGIPRASLERIFEPFFRAPGVHARGEGIGLATVRRIVEAHGGSIHVDSTEGSGSTFRVLLPLGVAASEPRAHAEAGQASG